MNNDLQKEFKELMARWEKETQYMSAITNIAMHPSFQRIIGMGPQVLPLIFAELKKEHHVGWFWALKAISGVNPVGPADAGNMDAIAQKWLEWGQQNGHITE